MKINGKTKIFGFLGNTYEHSMTYALYNRAFDALKINAVYIPFRVADIKNAVKGIINFGITGVGVTIPYKSAVVPYLDILSQDAQKIKAVNFIINEEGLLKGGNTDGQGAIRALEELTSLKNKNVLVLGTGGLARAICHELVKKKLKVVVFNRSAQNKKFFQQQFDIKVDLMDTIKEKLAICDILINATPVGMHPDNNSLVDIKLLSKRLFVCDMVLNPLETRLVSDARKTGCRVLRGDRMFFHQAILKFKEFTKQDAPVKIMAETLEDLLKIGKRS